MQMVEKLKLYCILIKMKVCNKVLKQTCNTYTLSPPHASIHDIHKCIPWGSIHQISDLRCTDCLAHQTRGDDIYHIMAVAHARAPLHLAGFKFTFAHVCERHPAVCSSGSIMKGMHTTKARSVPYSLTHKHTHISCFQYYT